MEFQLPDIEASSAISNVISNFAAVIDFIRKLYFLIYNAIALIAGNPTKDL